MSRNRELTITQQIGKIESPSSCNELLRTPAIGGASSVLATPRAWFSVVRKISISDWDSRSLEFHADCVPT